MPCLYNLPFEGLIHQVDPQDEITNVGVARTTMKLLESAFALLTMATDPNSRNLKLLGDLGTPPVAMDYLTDETIVSVQLTLPPSTINLLYLRNYRFYVPIEFRRRELRRTEPAKMDRTGPNRRYSFPPKWTEPAQTTLLPAKMDQPAK